MKIWRLYFLNDLSRHTEWRKLAKKARRKRIRQNSAKLRDQEQEEDQRRRESFPGYRIWLELQSKAEEFQALEEARLARERTTKKLETAREERARQNEKIKLEWEREQERQKQIKEQKDQELMEKFRLQELLTERTNDFIVNGGDTPEHLKTKLETNPNKPPCPFFQKTSACRFYDVCSRNHIRPGISRIILISGFFTHYSLETTENEHGSDSSLEFENYETLFKTCCNHEPHLRGNVYVEYATTRAALKSWQVLNGRWNLYNSYEKVRSKPRTSIDPSDRRNWRWSESPERIPSIIECKDRGSRHNKHSIRKHRSRSKSRDTTDRNGKSHSRNKKRDYSRDSKTPETCKKK
ncbi:hypothetical protein NQ314_004315 [Rhamnusium bicolor]|uniref:C3H1-type domain-containing protein n=1 Tax=Rhamnusium bicolor TaxID=1586634 RepID=A0AAV8ZJS6_9CUCU|nr:hypothetical protein NQ314_004315 [Rhamnusium bicolor]